MDTKQEQDPKRPAGSYYYSPSFKQQVIDEYLQTGQPKEHIERKYGLSGHGIICKWLRKAGYADPYAPKVLRNFAALNDFPLSQSKDPQKQSQASLSMLEAEIARLKKRLADEQLRSELYERMITLAEKEYKIAIRKNSNTK
ncbi:MAG: transposase [Chitinophagales bacterium]